jgi:hypothetical protein
MLFSSGRDGISTLLRFNRRNAKRADYVDSQKDKKHGEKAGSKKAGGCAGRFSRNESCSW